MSERRFLDHVRCKYCRREYRLHALSDGRGGFYEESCSACSGCDYFVPCRPVNRVVTVTVRFEVQRCGVRRKPVRKKIGWILRLSCGHEFTCLRKLATFACSACVEKIPVSS